VFFLSCCAFLSKLLFMYLFSWSLIVKSILFADIPEGGLAVTLPDDSWLPKSLQAPGMVPEVSFLLQRQAKGVLLTGRMDLVLNLQCDRCLDTYQKRIIGEFSVNLVVGVPEPISKEHGDYICKSDDLDTMFLDSAQVDLLDMAQQQLYLQLPVKKICEDRCPGLCQCGEKVGSEACICEKIIDSPFAALASIVAAKKD
jgi:uncharacterized metal-binding protein YceD (DUF177 family)